MARLATVCTAAKITLFLLLFIPVLIVLSIWLLIVWRDPPSE
jgi:hypothetical protein